MMGAWKEIITMRKSSLAVGLAGSICSTNYIQQGIEKTQQVAGQIFDAYQFVCDLIRTARNTIIIIDNYIDDTVLTYLTKRNKGIKVTIFTKTISKQLALDIKKFNAQYPPIDIKEFKNSHDRIIIIDDKTMDRKKPTPLGLFPGWDATGVLMFIKIFLLSLPSRKT